MRLEEDGIEIDFSDAITAVKFDEKSSHGLSHCMKAVDFIIELADSFLFVEVKDPSNPKTRLKQKDRFNVDLSSGKIEHDLVVKFRDTFIYRWAVRKDNKPIRYLVLITLEDALLNSLQTRLCKKLPMEIVFWDRQIVQCCFVLNMETWNRNFPKWPVIRKTL